MTIIIHELKVNLKSLLIWSLSISITASCFMLMYPILKDSLKDMGEQLKNMQGFSAALGMDKLSIYTPMGYYGTQVGYILSLGGGIFAALLGTGMLSKEEGNHTSEYLLSAPISRGKIVIEKVCSILIIIGIFEIIYILSILLAFLLIGDSIQVKEFWIYHASQTCMHMEIAFICYAISAFLRKSNVGLGIGLALLLYFLDIMEKTIKKLDWLKYITPFTYSGAGDVMTKGEIETMPLLIGIAVCVVSFFIAYIKYVSKDISA